MTMHMLLTLLSPMLCVCVIGLVGIPLMVFDMFRCQLPLAATIVLCGGSVCILCCHSVVVLSVRVGWERGLRARDVDIGVVG